MRHTPTNKLLMLRVYLGLLGTFTLFWRSLSHWFYPEWYHWLLAFESFDPSLVTIIGTTGLIAVLNIFFAALDPVRNRAMMTVLIVFSVAMAATYLFLIQTKGFPEREYANMTLLIVNTIVLIALYPRPTKVAGA